jgi:hypothetical protein
MALAGQTNIATTQRYSELNPTIMKAGVGVDLVRFYHVNFKILIDPFKPREF